LSKSQRLKGLCQLEDEARLKGYSRVAGVDEAGRGPLAGPVVAAACIVPQGIVLEGIDDSKKLSPAQRERLYQRIMETPEICKEVGIIEAAIIDQINILRAALRAMAVAIGLVRADYILVDGRHLPPAGVPGKTVIRGDSLSQSIMAGSIVAKVTRDKIMGMFHEQWPEYGFREHKGYGTLKHLQALRKYGPSPIHRHSFEPVKSWKA